MSHAATLVTAPDLQALFDQDWSSGKYRRPKCSKSDFYAGWLVAYERFKIVAPVEKITVVKAPAAAPAKPKRAAAAAKPTEEQWSEICRGHWVRACTGTGTTSNNTGCLDICQEDKPKLREMHGYRYENGHAMRNLCDTMRKGKHGRDEWVPAADEHNKLVTVYRDTPMFARQVTKGPAPNQGKGPYSVVSGQAIPDAMLRKLAAAAGRPSLAP